MIKFSSTYNGIIGKPALNKIQVTISIYVMLMTFLIDYDMSEVKKNSEESIECKWT